MNIPFQGMTLLPLQVRRVDCDVPLPESHRSFIPSQMAFDHRDCIPQIGHHLTVSGIEGNAAGFVKFKVVDIAWSGFFDVKQAHRGGPYTVAIMPQTPRLIVDVVEWE